MTVEFTSLHAARPACPDVVEKVDGVRASRRVIESDVAARRRRQRRQHTDHQH